MRSARKLRRTATLVAISALLAALAVLVLANVGEARPPSVATPSAAPVAAINLGDLLGNENEPDENEADEGAPAAQKQNTQASGVSIPVMIGLVVLALFAGGYAAIRVQRMWLRLRGWGRGMRARL